MNTPRWQTLVTVLIFQIILSSHGWAGPAEPLPRIGPAPAFSLTDQNGEPFTLRQLRGQVAVVTFIFTSCSDSCPLLTAKLVQVHDMLGRDEPKVFFVGITVDPLHDSPAVLKRYAELYSASEEQFAFLTGDFDTIYDVVRRYGAYFNPKGERDVDHTFLTSIVDQSGILRVQYLGWRFDPDEFVGDLRSLVHEDDKS
ncbi:MAG: SCO family protein [Betaproteobacteria bacterium]|jgi:protein SCO1/2|nr:MAG: SCO family protein [Betaproteobacteria bacterium]